MKIRSVTLFSEPSLDPILASQFFTAAREAFHVPVQTTRWATPPFPEWVVPGPDGIKQAVDLTEKWFDGGVDFIGLGPVRIADDDKWLNEIPEFAGAEKPLSTSIEIANGKGVIDISRCWAAADIISQLSKRQENGFGNFYFAALANCGPGFPFFPVAYHQGGSPQVAIALEAADLAVSVVHTSENLIEARQKLVTTIEDEAAAISIVAEKLASEYGFSVAGVDFTFAPFPAVEQSLGEAMEGLGLGALGAAGSIFSAAFLAEAIDRASFDRCGYSGLIFPVFEDAVVAQRVAEGGLTIQDLLSYATVCGTGLDTIPLPGNTSKDVLTGILLDIAALAVRLDKPLTARLMPLPGYETGDEVHFDFPYFADTRVMAVRENEIKGMMSAADRVQLKPYHPRVGNND